MKLNTDHLNARAYIMFMAILCLLLTQTANASSAFSITLKENVFVRQDPAKMDCGPAAIFNSFSIGNAQLKSSLQKLKGRSQNEKYVHLIESLTQKPSVHFAPENRPRTSRNNGFGTASGDMDAILKDLINLSSNSDKHYFNGGFSYRQLGEAQHTFSERIHKDIVYSLQMGFPPIINRTYYSSFGFRNYAHFVVVYAISELKKTNAVNTFTVTVFDSLSGTHQNWQVEETNSFFEAYSWEMNKEPMNPVILKNAKGQKLSPYLILRPSSATAQRTVEAQFLRDDSNGYIVLEQMYGLFETPELYSF